MKIKIIFLTLFFVVFSACFANSDVSIEPTTSTAANSKVSISANKFISINQGLWLGEFNSPAKSITGTSRVTVLKINPRFYSLKLLSAGEKNTGSITADAWVDKFNLIAVINASMYLQDHKTSTGYMKNVGYVNNKNINKRFGAFMVFNVDDSSLPPVQIIDRTYQDWKNLIGKYKTVVQNYRMVSLKQENVWKQKIKIFSIACVGMDKEGNVLFIHSRSPYSIHDFNNILLELPLNIRNVMYVEGGPEASLYVKTDKFTKKCVGSYETNFWDVSNKVFWQIPNVIGIVKK